MRIDTEYEIRIEGCLEPDWSDWFEGLQISVETSADGQRACTLLKGRLDQAGLHGVMNKLRDLGLALVSVNPVEERAGSGTARQDDR